MTFLFFYGLVLTQFFYENKFYFFLSSKIIRTFAFNSVQPLGLKIKITLNQYMKNRNTILALIFLGTITLFLHVLVHEFTIAIPSKVLTLFRWATIGSIAYWTYLRRALTGWILFSMVLGIELGYSFPDFSQHLNVCNKVFIRLIKTIIAPLLFGTLVVGIAGHSNIKQVGRMGWKSLLYFEIVTTIALFIGLAAINITGAGLGIAKKEVETTTLMPASQLTVKLDTTKNTFQLLNGDKALSPMPVPVKQKWEEVVLHIFPENAAKMIYDGQVLQIVIFSILFGIALLFVRADHRKTMLHWAESLTEVMFKFTAFIMYFAPVAVGAAMAYTVGHMGLGVLKNLFLLVATLYIALLAFIFGVLLPVALIFKIDFLRLLRTIAEPVSLAFATTSSEVALPKAMNAMEKFGVPRKIIAFVLPMGYSFNLDGTTLYLSLATIFVAQAAGIDLSLGQQLLILLTLMLTSKGVAGVPRASLVILFGTAASFGLPEWPIYLIMGIDELMDMARTSVNVIGNCLASAVIARSEGELAAPDLAASPNDQQNETNQV